MQILTYHICIVLSLMDVEWQDMSTNTRMVNRMVRTILQTSAQSFFAPEKPYQITTLTIRD